MHKQIATIISISPKEELKPNLSKVAFLVETEERYPQIQQYEIFNDHIEILKGFGPNDRVEITFNIRTSKSTSDGGKVRYFNSLRPSSLVKVPVQLGTSISATPNDNPTKS